MALGAATPGPRAVHGGSQPYGCTGLGRPGQSRAACGGEGARAAQTSPVTKISGGSSSPGSSRKGEIAGIPTRYIAIGGIGILAIWFLFANLDRVKIQFWVFTVTAPLWITLLVTLVAGGALGWLLKGRRDK